MNAREAGLLLGLEAHEWHLLFSWTDRSGPSRHLCLGALVKNVSSNPMACTSVSKGARYRWSRMRHSAFLWRRMRGSQCQHRRAIQLKCPFGCPPWVGVCRFCLHSSGQLSGIALVLEREMHFRLAGFPEHSRCVVARRFLNLQKISKHDLCCPGVWFATQLIRAQYGDHEVGSRLTVLE